MKNLIIGFSAFLLLSMGSAQARIMDDDEAKLADTSLLENEASMFKNIRMGIALSFAFCEDQASCSPSVDSNEVKRLISKLDNRINDLTLRQESVEDPVEYDQVLSLYVDERDNYSAILQRLGTVEEDIEDIAAEEEMDLSEPELEDTLAEETPVVEDEASEVVVEQVDEPDFFEDSDLDLEDDEDMEEFEDDFDPSQE